VAQGICAEAAEAGQLRRPPISVDHSLHHMRI
jgi:hypothetical protein